MRNTKTKAPARTVHPRLKIAPSTAATSEHAEELMALAVEAARSRHLPDFLNRFAERSAHMLKAMWGGVVVFRGRDTEVFDGRVATTRQSPERKWLFAWAREARNDIQVRALQDGESGYFSSVASEVPVALLLVPITASDGERLGTLCLASSRTRLSAGEKRLLEALASHAALSLENFRRFSQLERSK